ncbi:YkgJ family cysteine cluster protein [Methanosarcina sp. MSH10X1]|uniref:YkgJ family cysteine cluster protein n=1 Tax=Methanosarcina sp. MSH10X1 TaxID=2507075 RepID=UPI000FFC2D55|nr:YkgJ family cysteine cluster protein [Methanosarcina sp. MSH10X1]RXA17399.1 YkgJ family cysteine cluster protein [Methanosarcina sp. MSH10X1]
MILKKIPMQTYENFHKMFSGSNQNTFNICRECGGACEHNKIGTLLPGEEEYMAEKMGISVSDLKIRYLDMLKMDDGTQIQVLKLGRLCPFLNEDEVCKCGDFKPIFCKIYPVILTIENEKINYIIDDWCNLSKKEACRLYFETAIPLLSNLAIPIEWLRHVISYDNLCFDYDELEKCRRGKNKYAIFSLDELLSLQKAELETSRLCIDFGQKAEELIF